ncbi:MAG: DUF6371 domain-containing protein [Candidatus Cyclonatronum sp.]|uniref:DUF6371 domain-containing protein n=1 Tax=Cyclonatronum sp. TaxID=3024185 RepID=UPI0025C627EB|nr:DUF6371 domain-containing protein [Cyclonatronum sp.]MCH8487281.1 DUF6371 domain-containing protein [Cyclonatronum sp.]
MKAEPRFSLDTNSKKHVCPACKKRRFVPYLDKNTGQPLNPDVGKCDRAESCSYHLTPREYFQRTGTRPDSWQAPAAAMPKPKPEKPGRLPFSMVQKTLNRYDENQLVKWMAALPGWNAETAEQAARMYHVGTGSGSVNGWPIFWQIDNQQQARSGKLIRYNESTGKRIKEGYSYDWIHSKLKKAGRLPADKSEWCLDQCLFGLHLIRDDISKPVAIVESEKTALIASVYVPSLLWMAAGALEGLQTKKLMPLKGRDILLFPDKGNAYQKWQERAEQLRHMIRMKVSSLLEQKAPAEHDGYDIADYLIQHSISAAEASNTKPGTVPAPHGMNPFTGEIFDERGYPADWDDIQPPEHGTAEALDMVKAELDAGAIDETEFIKQTDPKAARIISLFDAVPEQSKSRAYMI